MVVLESATKRPPSFRLDEDRILRKDDDIAGHNGTTLEFEGRFQDGKMILQGVSQTRQGEERLNRVTWTKNDDGTVRRHWEGSTDQGKTWKTLFDGLYKKKE